MFDSFAKRAVAVTCSDTVAIAPGARWLSVKTAGDYTVLLNGDTVAVTMNLAAGVMHRMAVKRVNLTGAAATTGVVAFY
jgi:hypothetical protein